MDIGDWLEQNGLGKYASVFAENEIDFIALPEITEGDLREMGLPIGPRRKLLKAAQDIVDTDSAIDPADSSPSRTGDAERRQITIMFCDLVGSTALSEKLDPEDLRELMTAYQKAAGAVIERYEGHVAQYLGDGLMVYFGWPKAHEEDAVRAVQSSLELIEVVKGVAAPEPLQVRTGIATGQVVVGETGAGDASVPKAAVGETPNVAARLQGLAGPDEIVIAPTTYALAGGAFDYDDLGEQILKGIVEPLRAWRVVSKSTAEGRFEAHATGRLTPLVGRESEIGMLLERWTEVKDGEGQVVLLSGEPGIGKSRMTQVLRERLASEPHTRLRYQCSPYYTNTPFYPIIDQLERAAGFARDETRESRLDKLEALLTQGTEKVAEAAPLLAALLSLPVERYPPLNLSPQRQKEQTFEVLAEGIAGLARQNPVLMIFEDVHWVDPTTLDVLGMVVDRIQNSAVLLVITYRPEFEPPWGGYSHVTLHSLNRLSRRQGAQMVADVTGGKTLSDEVRDQIIAKTDGVPLFVEELTKAVLEARLSEGRKGQGAADSTEAIPATLQDSLMARLDRLDEGKPIAQQAAAIGREFSLELLVAVTSADRRSVERGLDQLVNAELLFQRGAPPNFTYTFKHAMLQDAAYESLLRSAQRALHGRIGAALRDQFPERCEAEPEVTARHFDLAGDGDEAILFYERAGTQAISRTANAEAIGHLERAVALLSDQVENEHRVALELRLQLALAGAMGRVGEGWLGVAPVYERARSLASRVGDDRQRCFALIGVQLAYLFQNGSVTSLELAEEVVSVAERIGDPFYKVSAHATLGFSLYLRGDFPAALEQLDRAIKNHQIGQPTVFTFNSGAFASMWGGACMWTRGYPDRALATLRAAEAIAEEIQEPITRGSALNWRAIVHLERGELERAQECNDEAFALCEVSGESYGLGRAAALRARLLAETGDPEAAAGQLQYVMAEVEKASILLAGCQQSIWLAECFAKAGRSRDALQTIDSALADSRNSGQRFLEAELLRLRAALVTDVGQAEHLLREALSISRRQDAKSLELRAATSLARLWQQQGKQAEARELLSEIYEWFTEGFDTKDLKDTKALLEELG